MKSHFRMLAAYNAWANDRLFTAVSTLSPTDYRAERGGACGSLHMVLNRALVADRNWLQRLTGDLDAPLDPEKPLYDDLQALRVARRAEDERLILVVDAMAEFGGPAPIGGSRPAGEAVPDLGTLLMHIFNKQSHFRGQAHGLLEMARGGDVPSFDLLVFQREQMTSRKSHPGDASRPERRA